MKRFELSDLEKGAHIHFIGIGGISMSGLATVLMQKGFFVSGSDREKTHITDKLEKQGAVIYEGHKAENIKGADLVVHTAAVHMDNPEMMAADAANIRLIDRAECLGAIMKQYKYAVGVAGTHGKTTTTAMLTHALLHAGTDPTVSIGGELDAIGGNIRAGESDYFVTEACEYTNSFLKFFPYIAVITNVEEDHLDFFSGIEDIKNSFAAFADLCGENGYVVANRDDKNVCDALKNCKSNIVSYGKTGEYSYQNEAYEKGSQSFDVLHNGEKITRVELHVPGEHNIMNALAVIAVCGILGIDPKTTSDGIATFYGTHRRFENLGTLNGADVIADYAHHPTEIRATINAAKKFSPKKLWCVFQPHTYTRTKTLWKEFTECFEGADKLIITDIYAAREKPDGITTSDKLCEDIKRYGTDALYIKEFSDIEKYLSQNACGGDMILVLGAGNIIDLGYSLTSI